MASSWHDLLAGSATKWPHSCHPRASDVIPKLRNAGRHSIISSCLDVLLAALHDVVISQQEVVLHKVLSACICGAAANPAAAAAKAALRPQRLPR